MSKLYLVQLLTFVQENPGLWTLFLLSGLILLMAWVIFLVLRSLCRLWIQALEKKVQLHENIALLMLRVTFLILVPWCWLIWLLILRLRYLDVWDLRPWLSWFWQNPVLWFLVIPLLAVFLDILAQLRVQFLEAYVHLVYFLHLRMLDFPPYFWCYLWLLKIKSLLDDISSAPDNYLWKPDPRFPPRSWLQLRGWKLWRPCYRWDFIAMVFPRKHIYQNRWPLVLLVLVLDLIWHWGQLFWLPKLLLLLLASTALGFIFQHRTFVNALSDQICARDYLYGRFPSLPKEYLNQARVFRSSGWPERFRWPLVAGPGQLGIQDREDLRRLLRLQQKMAMMPARGFNWNRGWLEGRILFAMEHRLDWTKNWVRNQCKMLASQLSRASQNPGIPGPRFPLPFQQVQRIFYRSCKGHQLKNSILMTAPGRSLNLENPTPALAVMAAVGFTPAQCFVFAGKARGYNFTDWMLCSQGQKRLQREIPDLASWDQSRAFFNTGHLILSDSRAPQDTLILGQFAQLRSLADRRELQVRHVTERSSLYQTYEPSPGQQAKPEFFFLYQGQKYTWLDCKQRIGNFHEDRFALFYSPVTVLEAEQGLDKYTIYLNNVQGMSRGRKKAFRDLLLELQECLTDPRRYNRVWSRGLSQGLYDQCLAPNFYAGQSYQDQDLSGLGRNHLAESKQKIDNLNQLMPEILEKYPDLWTAAQMVGDRTTIRYQIVTTDRFLKHLPGQARSRIDEAMVPDPAPRWSSDTSIFGDFSGPLIPGI